MRGVGHYVGLAARKTDSTLPLVFIEPAEAIALLPVVRKIKDNCRIVKDDLDKEIKRLTGEL